MTTPQPVATYRFEADAGLAARLYGERLRRLRHPGLLVALLVSGLVLGVGASVLTNAAVWSYYPGRILLIGVVWGLCWVLVVLLSVVVLLLPLVKVINGRSVRKRYPPGSVTEVEIGEDELVVRRPSGSRSLPYAQIRKVRRFGSIVSVEVRGRFLPELLLTELLPEEAVEVVRARAGRRPRVREPGVGLEDDEPTRRMVVPPGWAAHLAAVHTRRAVRGRRFWARVGLLTLAATVLAALAGPAWLMAVPALALVIVLATYAQARRAIGAALPAGSVATTQVLDDRFVSRNAGGTREIRFDDVRSVEVSGDVLLLELASQPGNMLIARDWSPTR